MLLRMTVISVETGR